MNFIEEQRKQILEENNTAQADFLDYLENLPPTSTVIDVQIPLSGDVDCEVLSKCSFTGISAISFVPGNITSLKNVPQAVTKIMCAENILKDIPVLPESVMELDLQKNAIKLAQGPWPRDLKELNLTENQITSLEDLPEGLEVLKIDNCRLKVLRLDGLVALRVLHCSGNPGLIIENVPDTLTDFQCDNDVITEINKLRGEGQEKEDSPEKRANYQECLNEFFRLKSAYENKVLKMKRDAYRSAKSKKESKVKMAALRPKCIFCDRPVGSIFMNKERTFIARCGDRAHPCGFHIELFGGEYEPIADKMEVYGRLLNLTKEMIIKDKLDVIFSYISESQGVDFFKDNLDDYTKDNHHLQTLKREYDNLYFNEEQEEKLAQKKKKIAQIRERIQEIVKTYKIEENPEALKDAMTIYIQEFLPEIDNEALIRFQTREIDFDEKTNEYTLYQRGWRPNQVEYTFGEYPRVVHYRVR